MLNPSVPEAARAKLGGTILKKCDRALCRPGSNRLCAAGTCQHTCETRDTESCSHKWTFRYDANGKTREKSYATLALAQDAQLKLAVTKKEQGRTFIDPKLADEMFMPAAETYLRGRKLNADTLARHPGILKNHIGVVFGGRMLAYMTTAEAASEVETLVNDAMEHISRPARGVALFICRETMNAAQRAGKVASHKIIGIQVTEGTHISRRDARADDEGAGLGFVFLPDAQVASLAEGMKVTRKTITGKDRAVALKGIGFAVVLQRRMGLRIREALGVEKADFRERRDGSRYLRLREQATEDGRGRCPLKHRKPGKGRDIPCPDEVWEAVQAMPDGPLCPSVGSRYLAYNTTWNRFSHIIRAMGVEGFTTHSLRHQFATETLEAVGVDNIAALSEVLGHKNVETTLRTYINSQELHQAGEKPQVSRSRDCRNSVLLVLMPAS